MNKIYQKSFSGGKNAAFTLIELLVVVLIIGILAAVAVPQYQLAVYKSHFVKIRPFVDNLARAQEVYYMANGHYSRDLSDLDVAYPSSCTYSPTNGLGHNILDCPDARLFLETTHGGIQAYVKHCPVNGDVCAIYALPYHVHTDTMGKGPSCRPYLDSGAKVSSFGEKLCRSLGGKKDESHSWRYYL